MVLFLIGLIAGVAVLAALVMYGEHDARSGAMRPVPPLNPLDDSRPA